MKKKRMADPVAPVAPVAPVTPLPDPDGATVQTRIEKARKAAASRFGRSALGLAGGKPTAPVKAARPTALGSGY